jgi:hypothetical protein
MRDLEKELQDDDYPTAWTPEPGEILVGTIYDMDQGPGFQGGMVNTVMIEKDDGERVSVWLTHQVLQRQFEGLRPARGERVGIKYKGLREGASGTPYHDYKTKVDRPESYGALGGEEHEAV